MFNKCYRYLYIYIYFFFFFNDTPTTEIYTLSLHDALPICGKEIRLGLKTQEQRSFPCNRSLKKLLKAVKGKENLSKTLVFPSPAGKMIDTNNFRNRVWKKVLNGLGIEYRKLYQTRHTFITHALEAGMDAKDVARLVGNSPEVIYRHYAGKSSKLEVPEF